MYRRFTLATVCIVLFGACARSAVPNAPVTSIAPLHEAAGNAGYQLVYSFGSQPDGIRPLAGLTLVNGRLWSTTGLGGTGSCTGGIGCGTIFAVTPAGKERIVYRFKGTPDGSSPSAGLTMFKGNLYGTTSRGGDTGACATGCGTVFQVSTSGTEKVVYRFKEGKDGGGPYAGLLNFNGALFGTTARGGGSTNCGGSTGCGVVFRVTPEGNERVVYAFKNSPDGAVPLGGLIAINGTLYGTTQQGGKYGRGTVFKLVPSSGTETVVYSFKGPPDGSGPVQDLAKANGVLYGITQNGGTDGTKNCGSTGCGTVYSVTTSGRETVLHRFTGSPDGTHPYASVTPVNGDIYGTTGLGGLEACYMGNGCGVIFRIKKSANGYTEKVLYNFTVSGTYPQSGFTQLNGALYATSHGGGKNGLGSVYSFTP